MSDEASLQRRVCVVTGGALGIGGAISRRFGRTGDHVILNDLDGPAAAVAAAEIEASGGACSVVIGDITEPAVVDELVAAIDRDANGIVDVLVNNVGDFRPASPIFLRSTPEAWDRLYRLNLLHVLAVTHALAPRMVERGRGSIVNLSTVEAYRGIPGHAVYSAFKAGVSAFTKSLAVELAGSGVRVNGIAPDLADTEQTPAELMLAGRDPALIRTWVPLGRFGDPDDYASVVEFLASDAAGFVTGQTLPVDGGTLAASGWYARSTRRGWTNLPDAT
ncbi:SDR family oxidoreductase [Leifsonia sp. H3M29-4]|uniref:SDR family NAD(P)-dependent oxidoreductase n=1 Tax=Salinibacterium metalliresistens TaxID=3031321 RepID=UPI0023DBACD9|nr:SDR family oxidoreductase [Salinibacterium metalliresistens]MDF1478498.1 SDR family oxidoreductase [Salinibacterium metalliresistens]